MFVGVSEKDEYGDITSNDVIIHPHHINRENTRELTVWLYKKDDSGKTKVGESRNLRLLSSFIDNPKALTSFRNGADLKVAYQLTEDLKQDFMTLLYKAESALIEAAGIVATIDYNPEALEVARRLSQNVKLIGNTIKAKKVSDDEDF